MKFGRIAQAGTLNRRVQIQQRTVVVDAEGNSKTTWATVATVSASIQAMSLQERIQAGQLEQDVTHLVTMRYPAPVTHESQLIYNGRTFDVRSVNNVNEGNAKLEVTCFERRISG